ncbi:hypothetical protein J2129_001107 [Methanofollis sp. W23]|nr:hypothetical protein [Methanofollis sp. W23]
MKFRSSPLREDRSTATTASPSTESPGTDLKSSDFRAIRDGAVHHDRFSILICTIFCSYSSVSPFDHCALSHSRLWEENTERLWRIRYEANAHPRAQVDRKDSVRRGPLRRATLAPNWRGVRGEGGDTHPPHTIGKGFP